MGVNWNKMYVEVEGCKNVKELEEFLMECGVEKGNVFRIMKKSCGNYGRDRDYREKRNKGLKELRSEKELLERRVKELEGK